MHLCIDMQRLFAPGSPWQVPWLAKVLPAVQDFSERFADRTIFSRFIPAGSRSQMRGAWQRFYARWDSLTLHRIDPGLLDLVGPLQALCPPAHAIERWQYSCFTSPQLVELLRGARCDTLIVTGGETDVCVLATVLAAVDLGYRVVIAADGMCSSQDATHDAVMTVYRQRFSQQIETASLAEIADALP